MRVILILCFVAIATADKLGFNYQPVAHSDNGLSFEPGSRAHSASSSSFSSSSSSVASSGLSSNAYLAPSNSAPSHEYLAPSNADAYVIPTYESPAELEKEFYTFSAPEAEFEDANAAQRIVNSVKQGLRVVFIKGPENQGFEDAALAIAKQAAQQQTAIYVLNKQADIGDLVNKLNAAGKNVNTKPEVHFVKYRTPEDASNAQKAIQSQYDSLGGKSQSINGGFAPVINFASQSQSVSTPTVQEPQSAYLPSSIFRLRF